MKISRTAFVSRHKEQVERITYSLFCLKLPTMDPLPLGKVKGCLSISNPDNRRKKHRCPPYLNKQIFVSENRVEVDVKVLLVGREWFARFSRAISVASATNEPLRT